MLFQTQLPIQLLFLVLSIFIVFCNSQNQSTVITASDLSNWNGPGWSTDSNHCWVASLNSSQQSSPTLFISAFGWSVPQSANITQILMKVTHKKTNDGSSVSDVVVNLNDDWILPAPRLWNTTSDVFYNYTYTIPNIYGWNGSVVDTDDFGMSYQVKLNSATSADAIICAWTFQVTYVVPSPSVTPSRTPTPSVTPSKTPTPSVTPSRTPTPSVTPSKTPSITPSPSSTLTAPSPSRTPSPSLTPSPSATPSSSPIPTPSPSESPSLLPSASPSVTPSSTPPLQSPSSSPGSSPTPSSSVSPTPSVSPIDSPSSSASSTPTSIPTSSVTPSISTSPSSASSSGSNKSNATVLGAAVGASAGGLCLLAILVVVVLFRRKKRQDGETAVELHGVPPAPSSTSSATSIFNDSDIHLKDVKILHMLGKGKFGEVYEGLWSDTTPVACKKLKQGERTEFENEIKLISKLNHPNIVRCLGIYVPDADTTYMVLELLKLGSLADFLRKPQSQWKLSVDNLVELCLNTAAGMSYLESKNIVHRDLGARNLLVTESDGKYIVKVSDFGLSRQVESDVYNASENVFPVRWSPPEVINYRKFSTKSDVWSFAVTCWEIFEWGKLPYPSMSNQECVEQVVGGYRLPQPKTCPDSIYKLMTECWKENPTARPDFKNIYTTIKNILADMKPDQKENNNRSSKSRQSQQPQELYNTSSNANTEGTYQTVNTTDAYNT